MSAQLSEQDRIAIEAAAFRGLVAHLQQRTDVQNIDLMNLAGFCRNCLSKWYLAAACERGISMTHDEARTAVYGMPYGEWKSKYQQEATPEQKRRYQETAPQHAVIDIPQA
ncbi:DUF1244 domain-containing protein [uncultured Thiohalocapsa sp.]|uniref:DUF1244 domain-containing protein n=1 Tax=uncultured Thiohalocapsa sp. TaxID=768990 RepID=UPI0025E4BC56|nr:DUF1244 domain-containing protein [uncultured Thiohalocapsa sp.]